MSSLITVILQRLVYSLGTLALVSVIIFAAVEVLPGDVAARVLGRESSEAARQQLRAELGLDRPAVERYLSWAAGAVVGDFGSSISARQPVSDIVATRIGHTLALASFAMLSLSLELYREATRSDPSIGPPLLPDLSEAVREAALAVDGRTLNL